MTSNSINTTRPTPFKKNGMIDDYEMKETSVDDKQKKIEFSSTVPSNLDGEEGDIRIGINYKGKSLLAVKQSGGWMFAKLTRLSEIT